MSENSTLYYLDINSVMDFVSKCPKDERNIVTTTTFTTNGEPSNSNESDANPYSEVSETKYSKNDTMNNIRYDLVKTLIASVLNDFESYTLQDSNFSTKIAFNSLFAAGLIKESIEKQSDID